MENRERTEADTRRTLKAQCTKLTELTSVVTLLLFVNLPIYLLIYLFSNSLPGFLGEGDVVTQAIHDAQLLLRSHSSAGGRERDKERERDGGGKMVRVRIGFDGKHRERQNFKCLKAKWRTGLILRPARRVKQTRSCGAKGHSCVEREF